VIGTDYPELSRAYHKRTAMLNSVNLCYKYLMKEALLTPKEVAQILKVSYMTVYRWLKAGKLSSYKIEKQYRVKKTDLQLFLEKYKQN
jgi:excisionase family DNA binding protein